MLNPAHPGEIIRDDTLPHFGLSVSAAARALNHDRASLHKILNGQSPVTPAMALKIEKAFGVSAQLLLNAQANWDLAQARCDAERITANVEVQQRPAA